MLVESTQLSGCSGHVVEFRRVDEVFQCCIRDVFSTLPASVQARAFSPVCSCAGAVRARASRRAFSRTRRLPRLLVHCRGSPCCRCLYEHFLEKKPKHLPQGNTSSFFRPDPLGVRLAGMMVPAPLLIMPELYFKLPRCINFSNASILSLSAGRALALITFGSDPCLRLR